MRFSNQFDSSKATNIWDILKWKLGTSQKKIKEYSTLKTKNDASLLDSKQDFICWLSHASFLIQLKGKRFLIDPIFGNIPFFKRKMAFPYGVETLGKIDYLLLSHTHYDHFDTSSIKQILPQKPQLILPLGMEPYLQKLDKNASIVTLDWYQSYRINEQLTVHFVPAKHWGRRTLFDTNRALWGGFIIKSNKHTLYFAGDTAYDTHFKEIGKRYTIDYALLPIGAYNPQFFMKHHHLNPQEAYQAYQDLNAKTMIPMHYGAFKLTDEPINEPEAWIDKIKEKHSADIYKMKVGEVLELGYTT